MNDTPRLGVNSCLLGHEVRYDGSHKHDRFVTDELGRFVHYVHLCPEVEAGFPIPREAFRLVGDPEAPRFMTARSGRDVTEQMTAYCRRRVEELAAENLCGFIFKSKSPSNALFRMKVYSEQNGMPVLAGRGLFARAFTDRFPDLPVEEDGRLNDPTLRETFLTKVFSLHRLRSLETDFSKDAWKRFHDRHRLLVLLHDPETLPVLDELCLQSEQPGEEADAGLRFARYRAHFLSALSANASLAKRLAVMRHIAREYAGRLSAEDSLELERTISDYERGVLPASAVLVLLKHHARGDSLEEDLFFEPFPPELAAPSCRI